MSAPVNFHLNLVYISITSATQKMSLVKRDLGFSFTARMNKNFSRHNTNSLCLLHLQVIEYTMGIKMSCFISSNLKHFSYLWLSTLIRLKISPLPSLSPRLEYSHRYYLTSLDIEKEFLIFYRSILNLAIIFDHFVLPQH